MTLRLAQGYRLKVTLHAKARAKKAAALRLEQVPRARQRLVGAVPIQRALLHLREAQQAVRGSERRRKMMRSNDAMRTVQAVKADECVRVNFIWASNSR
jgi:hypothetical protein